MSAFIKEIKRLMIAFECCSKTVNRSNSIEFEIDPPGMCNTLRIREQCRTHVYFT